MKKLTLSIFSLFFAFSLMASGGGEKDSKNNKSDGNVNSLLSVSGIKQDGASPDFPGSLVLEFGFNFLNDYPDEMELGFFGSKAFNVYYMYEFRIGNSPISFNPGFGLGLEKYSFDNNITLNMAEGGTEIVELSDTWDVKKTKLAANYFDIPLELRFHLNKDNFRKSFKIGIGGKAGILFASHTKVKYEENGDNKILKAKESFDLSRFRYGVQGRIGIGGFSLFYYQELSELFKDGKGPEATAATPFKIGLAFHAF